MTDSLEYQSKIWMKGIHDEGISIKSVTPWKANIVRGQQLEMLCMDLKKNFEQNHKDSRWMNRIYHQEFIRTRKSSNYYGNEGWRIQGVERGDRIHAYIFWPGLKIKPVAPWKANSMTGRQFEMLCLDVMCWIFKKINVCENYGRAITKEWEGEESLWRKGKTRLHTHKKMKIIIWHLWLRPQEPNDYCIKRKICYGWIC